MPTLLHLQRKATLMRFSVCLLLLAVVTGCGKNVEPAGSNAEQRSVEPATQQIDPVVEFPVTETPEEPALAEVIPEAVPVDEDVSVNPASAGMQPFVNSIGMSLVPIAAGTFTMGCPKEVPNYDDGDVQHSVTLSKPFYLCAYEVTQEQYEKVMGENPSMFQGPNNPVESVRWGDAVEFCRQLSTLSDEQKAGRKYRLPTEAEWEYSCRAGAVTAYSFGDDETQLDKYAWFGNNSGDEALDATILAMNKDAYLSRALSNRCRTHVVGSKRPNAWGLYDMHGNVFEWCQDWFGDYSGNRAGDPTGPATGSLRVLRGGCWFSTNEYCRSAYRGANSLDGHADDLGFRVVCQRLTE